MADISRIASIAMGMASRGPATAPRPEGAESRQVSGGKALPESSGKPMPEPPAVEQVEKAAARIQQFVSEQQRSLRFQVHEGSGRTVIRVIHPDSGDLIRQIPSDEALRISASLQEQGLRLFSAKA